MSFDIDYNKLIEIAANVCKRHELDTDPAELVNEAYIKFADSGNDYRIDEIKKYISNSGWKEFNQKCANKWQLSYDENLIPFITNPNKRRKSRLATEYPILDYKTCNICGETLGSNSFYRFFDAKRQVVYGPGSCKKCWNQKWYPKKRAYCKEWKRKAKEGLSDYYIRNLLHKKYSPENIKKNPFLITTKRRQLLSKRNRNKGDSKKLKAWARLWLYMPPLHRSFLQTVFTIR